MKPRTRWLACNPCGVLRDHTLDASGLTPFGAASHIETWICTVCGAGHPVSPSHSDQTDRERLERLGQMRLLD